MQGCWDYFLGGRAVNMDRLGTPRIYSADALNLNKKTVPVNKTLQAKVVIT